MHEEHKAERGLRPDSEVPVKALHVSTHINIGGIGNYILSLASALKSKGIDCVVASSGGSLLPEFGRQGIAHEKLDMKTKFEFGPKVIKSAFAIAGIIKKENIDIVHAHSRVSQVASRIACAMTGTPLVTTCHGYFKKRFRGIIDTWGEKVIAISDAVRGHLKDDLGVREERIVLIYNGVDPVRFSVSHSDEDIGVLKESSGVSGGPVIGTIGRLSSVKGHKFLVEAMAAVLSKHRNASMIIVGDGPEKAALKSLAKLLGIDKSVHFISSVLDTERMLAIMDVFVFPSIREGLGIALLEALAAGKACVASDVGGIGDIIKASSCGVLVKPCDARAIAESVSSLLTDPAKRKEMGENGRKVVRMRFSLEAMAEKVAGLYRDLVGSKSIVHPSTGLGTGSP